MNKTIIMILSLAMSMSALAIANNESLPRCSDEENLTPDILDARSNDNYPSSSRDYITRYVINSYRFKKDVPKTKKEDLNFKLLSYSKPKYKKSTNKIETTSIEGCMGKRNYMFVDYVLELENGEKCQDTLARFNHYSNKTYSPNCIATYAVLSPFAISGGTINYLENAIEWKRSLCQSAKCVNREFIMKLFKNIIQK